MGIIDEAKKTEDEIKSKEALFQRQKELLDTFLSHGAISQAQYDKSLHDMKEIIVYLKKIIIHPPSGWYFIFGHSP